MEMGTFLFIPASGFQAEVSVLSPEPAFGGMPGAGVPVIAVPVGLKDIEYKPPAWL
ncbi:hypothetical protein D3C73_1369940 [compost metagenome]